MTTTIRIQLLGMVRVFRGERLLAAFPTQRSKSLFSYLVLNRGRMFARDVLAGRFCGNEPQSLARKHLRSDLYRIRQTIEDSPDAYRSYLVAKEDQIGFNNAADYWLDVEEFERNAGALARVAVTADTRSSVEAALELYHGDLLEGVYDDWTLQEQERLRLMFLRGLERLMLYHEEACDWQAALICGERLLRYDPLREHVHRSVMRCHYRLGNRSAAVHQFRECERLLRHELTVAPMKETLALHRSILCEDEGGASESATTIAAALSTSAHVLADVARATAGTVDSPSAEALGALYRAAAEIDNAKAHLSDSIRLFERTHVSAPHTDTEPVRRP